MFTCRFPPKKRAIWYLLTEKKGEVPYLAGMWWFGRECDKAYAIDFYDLVSRMLIYNPEERIGPREALAHPYVHYYREFSTPNA